MSYDFDEQDLAQMQKHAFRTRRPFARLRERELDQLSQPVSPFTADSRRR